MFTMRDLLKFLFLLLIYRRLDEEEEDEEDETEDTENTHPVAGGSVKVGQ